MKKKLITIALVVLGVLGLSNESVQDRVGFSTTRGFSTLQTQEVGTKLVTLSSASFNTLATTSYELVPDPGDGYVVHLYSIAGYRNFSSESWDGNRIVDKGIGVGYSKNEEADVVASFSRGFLTGGALSSTASPQYEIKFPVDYVASPSEALTLKKVTPSAVPFIDGDTSFSFIVKYQIIKLP